jgi:DNA-binding protein HU-beta
VTVDYQQEIVSALLGRSKQSEHLSSDQLDWAGVSAVLALYRQTAGHDRVRFIDALKGILETGQKQPIVAAQVIDIANALSLTELDDSIHALANRTNDSEPLRDALNEYESTRHLSSWEQSHLNQREVGHAPNHGVVGKSEIQAAVAERAGLNPAQAARAVDAVLNAITNALQSGEEVRLAGFGTFRVANTAARTGRNPRTGESINIAHGKRPSFTAGTRLKGAVAESMS